MKKLFPKKNCNSFYFDQDRKSIKIKKRFNARYLAKVFNFFTPILSNII